MEKEKRFFRTIITVKGFTFRRNENVDFIFLAFLSEDHKSRPLLCGAFFFTGKTILIESMMGLKPRQGNLRLVSRLFSLM